MPRDHVFRSIYGLHFLKLAIGEGTMRPENLNLISQDVQPWLDRDHPDTLPGAAMGVWLKGSRLFASFGLHESPACSVTALASGFVSMNQATTYTEDRTPRFAVEGAWVLDHDMEGLHRFHQLDKGSFGFLASDRDGELYFALIDPNAEEDLRDGRALPIEWSCETGYFRQGSQLSKLSEGVLECLFSDRSAKVRVLVRTNLSSEWATWKEFAPCDQTKGPFQKFFRSEPLGVPPARYREALWFQFRIEGLGFVEIRDFRIALVEAGSIAGQSRCVAVGFCESDPLETNLQPVSNRWPSL
jgi:hypothetical protein